MFCITKILLCAWFYTYQVVLMHLNKLHASFKKGLKYSLIGTWLEPNHIDETMFTLFHLLPSGMFECVYKIRLVVFDTNSFVMCSCAVKRAVNTQSVLFWPKSSILFSVKLIKFITKRLGFCIKCVNKKQKRRNKLYTAKIP